MDCFFVATLNIRWWIYGISMTKTLFLKKLNISKVRHYISLVYKDLILGQLVVFILKPLRHDCQSFNFMMFYSCCKGTKNPEKLINKKKKTPKTSILSRTIRFWNDIQRHAHSQKTGKPNNLNVSDTLLLHVEEAK